MARLAICALATILVILVGVCDAKLSSPLKARKGWECGANHQAARAVEAKVPGVWSRDNDKVCKKTCKQDKDFPAYEDGNWAIFEKTGLECCCAIANGPFMSDVRRYGKSVPYAPFSVIMDQKINIHPLIDEYLERQD